MSSIAGIEPRNRRERRIADVAAARKLGINCLSDLVLVSCASCKFYVSQLTLYECDRCVEVELARTLPVGLPRPTILRRIADHAGWLHKRTILNHAKKLPKLSPHGRPRRPPPIAKEIAESTKLWLARPSHKAGASAAFYKAVKEQAAALAKD